MMQSQFSVPVVCLPVSRKPYRVNRHHVESGTSRLSYRPDLTPATGRCFFLPARTGWQILGTKKPGEPGFILS